MTPPVPLPDAGMRRPLCPTRSLLWFTEAARRLKLTTIGILQYIGPSGHFLLASFVYGEPLSPAQLFTCIWSALALYTFDGWRSQASRKIG